MSYPPPPQQYPQSHLPPPAYPPGGGYAPPGGPGGIPPAKGRKKYNSFTALFVFYLPDLWRDVGQRWWGIGLIYMFLLQLITWAPLFFQGHASFSKFVTEDAPKLTNQIPTITLNNGDISIDRPEPYTINDPDTGRALVVFDTSGDTTELPPGVAMLVTKHGFIMRKSPTQTQSQDLSQLKGFHQWSATDVQGWLKTSLQCWWPVIYPATTIVCWIWRLICMLVLAAIGLAFASGTKAPLSYAGLLRLSAIAMTPVILIDTVIHFVPALDFGCGWSIVGILLDLLMLFLAVKANAPKTPAWFGGPQGFPVMPSPAPYPYPTSLGGSPIPPPPQ